MDFTGIPVETLFAKALLKVEPEKFPGGSQERQDWLKLVLNVQEYIILHNLDDNLFRKELLDI